MSETGTPDARRRELRHAVASSLPELLKLPPLAILGTFTGWFYQEHQYWRAGLATFAALCVAASWWASFYRAGR